MILAAKVWGLVLEVEAEWEGGLYSLLKNV